METNSKLHVLTILVGLQGSGKSTWAKEHATADRVVVSSDVIRKIHPDWENEKVFSEVYSNINTYLSNGKNVILDATNTTLKSRRKIFASIRVPCYKEALIFNTSYDECIKRVEERNKSNEQIVPIDVVKKYLYSFEIPFIEEGFDYIDIVNKPSMEDSLKYQQELLTTAASFDQHNEHHTKNLLHHLISVWEELCKQPEKDSVLALAGMFHDAGKLFTQTYKPGDPNAHYYNHANVGTYYLMCNCSITIPKDDDYMYLLDETLKWLFYINYHMYLYNIKTDKSRDKYIKIFGNYKYNNLVILNKADMGGK